MRRIFYLLNHTIEINETQDLYIHYKKLIKTLGNQQVRKFKVVVSRECKSIDELALKMSQIVDSLFLECEERISEMLYELKVYDVSPEEVQKRFNRDYKNWREKFNFITATVEVAIVDLLGDVIKEKCLEMHSLFVDILLEKQILEERPYDLEEQNERAQILLDEIKSGLLNEDEVKGRLIRGISISPFRREFYHYSIRQYGPSKEVYEIAEYYGINIRNTIKSALMNSIQKLPCNSEDELIHIIELIKLESQHYPLIEFDTEIEKYKQQLEVGGNERSKKIHQESSNKFTDFIKGLKKRWKKS